MSGLVALTSGSAAETTTFAEGRYRDRLAGVAYTADPVDLDGAGGVWVPEGTPRRRLLALAPKLDALLSAGGAVLLFGDHQSGWPASAAWTWRPAGGAGETHLAADSGWSATEVGAAARQLHHHGVLTPPESAEVLLAAPDGAAVAYLDRPPGGGTLVVTTLDPLAHFGHTGSVEAARFLDAFLPWVIDTLLSRGDSR